MNQKLVPILVVLLASCGSSSDTDKTAPFVGTWTVSSGSLAATCTGLPMPFMQNLAGGQQTLTKTADGALSLTILPGCNVILDPNGNVATLRATTPPQMCMFSFAFMGVNVPVMGTFTSGNFTVAGTTASFTYMGSAAAQLLTCTVTGTGMSVKGAASDGGVAADGGSAADTAAAADTGSAADVAAASDTAATSDTAAATDTAATSDTAAASDGSTTDGP